MSEKNRSGLYYIIPAAIMESEDLSAGDKLLYGLLSGYASNLGTCFPSDQHLSEKMREPERTIKHRLKKLEDGGYISRETHPCSSNPFRKVRTITVHTEFKKCLPRATHCPLGGATHCPPEVPSIALIESKEEKKSIKEKEGVGPPDPLMRFEKGAVCMHKDEYGKLVSDFGKDLTDSTIEQLDLYAKIDPSKFKRYKDHYAVIRVWILKEKKKEKTWKAKSQTTFSEPKRNLSGRATLALPSQKSPWVTELMKQS